MTNEELKKKIVEVVLNSEITGIQIRAITGGYSMANNIADALISAGIGDIREAEHRAARAERALKVAQELGELCAPIDDYIKQAEKELAEEGER